MDLSHSVCAHLVQYSLPPPKSSYVNQKSLWAEKRVSRNTSHCDRKHHTPKASDKGWASQISGLSLTPDSAPANADALGQATVRTQVMNLPAPALASAGDHCGHMGE